MLQWILLRLLWIRSVAFGVRKGGSVLEVALPSDWNLVGPSWCVRCRTGVCGADALVYWLIGPGESQLRLHCQEILLDKGVVEVFERILPNENLRSDYLDFAV